MLCLPGHVLSSRLVPAPQLRSWLGCGRFSAATAKYPWSSPLPSEVLLGEHLFPPLSHGLASSAALKAHSSPVHSLTLLCHPSPPCSRFLQRGLSHSLCQGPPVLPSKDKPNVWPLPAWPSSALGWEHNSLRAARGEQNKAGRAFGSLGPLRNVPRQRSGSSAGVREAPGEGEYPAGLACRSQCHGTGRVREELCRGKHAWALRRPPLPAAATSATLRVSGLANLPEYPQEICRTALACGTRAEQSSPHVTGWGKLLLPARGLSAQPARGHQWWLSHSRPWLPALALPAGSGRALHGLVEREGFRKVLQVLVHTFFKKVPLLKRSYLLHFWGCSSSPGMPG